MLSLVGLLGTLAAVIAAEILLLVPVGEDVDGAGVLAVFLVFNHVGEVVCGNLKKCVISR